MIGRILCKIGRHVPVWQRPLNWKNGEYWTCRRPGCPKVGR